MPFLNIQYFSQLLFWLPLGPEQNKKGFYAEHFQLLRNKYHHECKV